MMKIISTDDHKPNDTQLLLEIMIPNFSSNLGKITLKLNMLLKNYSIYFSLHNNFLWNRAVYLGISIAQKFRLKTNLIGSVDM